MPKLSEWIAFAIRELNKADIPSARLDAEIILAHTIRKSRTFLHAHGDDTLDPRQHEIADTRLRLRLDRTPIAYIIGHKEFYGRLFKVTPATLIPRPESETIIELLKEIHEPAQQSLLNTKRRLVDVGTGSGCLGITAQLEFPELDVTLVDISKHALTVAEANAKDLGSRASILHSDLLTSYPFAPDIILANLPYVDKEWERSPETAYEPALALFAENHGLQLIEKLISQAKIRIASKGHLLLEADPRQHEAIITFGISQGFKKQRVKDFIVHLQRQ